ncbi:MAG: S-layer homology domain-containing protein, partial [Lachnospirales bacterium]
MIKKSNFLCKIKKGVSISLVCSLSLSSINYTIYADNNYVPYDLLIFNEQVNKIYTGNAEGDELIRNIDFDDTRNSVYGEDIAKLGAFDIIKGDGGNYRVNSFVSNIEAIISILRMQGLERDALSRVADMGTNYPTYSNYELVQLAYLEVAYENGYITLQERAEGRQLDSAVDGDFDRGANATKEHIAFWIGHFLSLTSPDVLAQQNVQNINYFSDFGSFTPSYIEEVEDVVALDIIEVSGNSFNPKGAISRGEFASYLSNIDKIYLDYKGYTKKSGVIGGIKTHEEQNVGSKLNLKDYYVRANNGEVDIIRNYNDQDNLIQSFTLDTPVYKNNSVQGVLSLVEGDLIEYTVDDATGKVVFISVQGQAKNEETHGRIYNIDFDNYTITIKNDRVASETYPLNNSIISNDNVIFKVDGEDIRIHKSEVPEGSVVSLSIRNGVVYSINYVGDMLLEEYIHGVVIENNADYGYLVIVDDTRNKQVFNYYNNDIIVEKQGHYGDDSVGYYDEMFESNVYDSRDTYISEIEAGDIVFIKTSEDDESVIESISASTNYIMRYGKIVSFVDNGDYSSMLVEYDNGSTNMFFVSDNIVILQDGKMIQPYDVNNGDYVKFLVNYAVTAPGVVSESVKELIVEGKARTISTIYKGEYGGSDLAASTVSLRNAKDLTTSSWANYSQLEELSIRKDLEIYHNDKRVDINYLDRYMKFSDAVTYVALEKSFGGDVVKQISIYDDTDFLLDRDFISTVSGNNITLSDGYNQLNVGDGSIIVKNGRLVDINSLMPNDYAHISRNGSKVAVANITEPINNNELALQRGRVYSVAENESFRVESIATYGNSNWDYSPVQRDYLIDYDTVFLNSAGNVISIDQFRDYSTNT